MCGINGFNWPDNDLLRSMCRVTHNRGPDDQGFYTDHQISLGHNRLSIIDLSPNGHQPMSNEDDSVWLVYNGEIYNFHDIRRELLSKGHSFKSKTDSEVIIHAYEEYGEDCVHQFNGMWAFCIYDRNKNRFFLSRDRFGIKPLYYYADSHRFIFSSMISAIRCHSIDTRPNDRIVMEYLAFNLLGHREETFFENIMTLPPGTNLIYDLDGRTMTLNRWLSLNATGDASVDRIRTAFTDSVRRRMLSDVQVGISQSGGMDSSAISCIFDSLHDGTFPTFSYIAPGASVDESQYIKQLGKLIKAEQHFTTVDKGCFLQEIEDFTQAMEEPVSSVSVFASYRVMKLAKESGVKVVLSGQGGDELFGGYVYYFGYLFYQLFRNLKWGKLLNEMLLYRRHFKSLYAHKLFFFLLSPAIIRQFIWKRWTNRWINHEYLGQVSHEGDIRWRRMNLNEIMRLTLESTAIPHMMTWQDKCSMRWGVECRVPFLDIDLVETALSLSSEERINQGRTRVLFRRATEDLIPPVIRTRKDKVGFETPTDALFREKEVADFAQSIIYSGSFKQRPYWNANVIQEEFRRFLSGESNLGNIVWKWINLEMWLRTFDEASTGAPQAGLAALDRIGPSC